MFSDLTAGFILLAAHLGGVFLVYAFSIPFSKPAQPCIALPVSLQKSDNVFAESVQSAVISILCVGGFIAYFCVIAKALENTKLMEIPVFLFSALFSLFHQSPAAVGFVHGLLECTRGCAELAAYGGLFCPALRRFLYNTRRRQYPRSAVRVSQTRRCEDKTFYRNQIAAGASLILPLPALSSDIPLIRNKRQCTYAVFYVGDFFVSKINSLCPKKLHGLITSEQLEIF